MNVIGSTQAERLHKDLVVRVKGTLGLDLEVPRYASVGVVLTPHDTVVIFGCIVTEVCRINHLWNNEDARDIQVGGRAEHGHVEAEGSKIAVFLDRTALVRQELCLNRLLNASVRVRTLFADPKPACQLLHLPFSGGGLRPLSRPTTGLGPGTCGLPSEAGPYDDSE